jgi:general transcription factor 3C polypeptide 5 (transcription factor C subunit 1)
MTRLKDTLLTGKYSALRDFSFDKRPGLPLNIGPPPSFCQVDMPFNYNYQQNALVKFTTDASGKKIAVNTNRPFQIIMHHVPVDAPTVPTGPHHSIMPESQLKKSQKLMVSRVRKLLETRPILTRRYMLNTIKSTSQDDLRQSLQHCGYHFVTGPWKDCLIAFGVDPRADPQLRMYQTLTFQVQFQSRYAPRDEWVDQRTVQHSYVAASASASLNPNTNPPTAAAPEKPASHLFDGTTVIPDGKVWQLCDITDAQLRRVLDAAPLRATCDVRIDGWFRNGTMAKVRGVMKDKLERIRKGEPPPDPALYERVLAFPDDYEKLGIDRQIYDGRGPYNAQESHLLAAVRNLARESWKGTRRAHGKEARGDGAERRAEEEEQEMEEDEDEDEDERLLEEEGDEEAIEEQFRRDMERGRRDEEENESEDSFFEDEEEPEDEADDDDDDDA